MLSVGQIIIMATAIVVAFGQDLEVTTGAQDYFSISQHELFHEVEMSEFRIDAFDGRFTDRLKIIQFQQDQVLAEIRRVNKTLMPLQVLSLVKKYCIQKYNKQLITYENASNSFETCYNKAETGGRSLTEDSKMYVANARSYVTHVFPREVSSCDTNYSQNQTALESCYIEYVEEGKTTTHSYLNSADEPLRKNAYEADVLSRTAVECSFQVEKYVLGSITIIIKEMDKCEAELTKQSTEAAVKASSTANSVDSLFIGKLN